MHSLGRFLQLMALIILPVGVVLEMTGRLGRRGVSEMLLIMIFGIVAFFLGRHLEAYGKSSSR